MTTIGFSEDKPFSERAISFTAGIVGLYFIFLKEVRISYPFESSRLIYIGMSESRQNSIGKRLRSHLTGQSGNRAIKNYASRHEVRFSYYPLRILEGIGTANLSLIESIFLEKFMQSHGAFPICNNQSGVQPTSITRLIEDVIVDWSYFK